MYPATGLDDRDSLPAPCTASIQICARAAAAARGYGTFSFVRAQGYPMYSYMGCKHEVHMGLGASGGSSGGGYFLMVLLLRL